MSTRPPPVARYQSLALAEAPAQIETVAIDTTATMRRPGLPPIPLQIRMSHRLGHEFVHDIRIGRGVFSFRFGLDAYIDGRGVLKVGRSVQTGPSIDQGALVALWGEALAFPPAWQGRTDVSWRRVDDDTALLVAADRQGEIRITVGFDQPTGFPTFCEAERYKADGPKMRWRGMLSDWRRFADGVLAPGRFQARWADEPYPWIDIRTRSVTINAPIEEALELGRHALGASASVASGEHIVGGTG
jgi:hypothetical protein